MSFKNFLNEKVTALPPKTKSSKRSLTKLERRNYLYQKYLNPLGDVSIDENKILNSAYRISNISTFKKNVNNFVNKHPDISKRLFGITQDEIYPKGIGPGEILCDFIFDDISIGGGSVSCDLLKRGEPFAEVKAAKLYKNTLTSFKFHTEGVVAYLNFINDVQKFVAYYNEEVNPENPIKIEKFSEMGASVLSLLRSIGDLNDVAIEFPSKGIPLSLLKSGDIRSFDKKVTNIDKESLPTDLKKVYNNAKKLKYIDKEISSFDKIEKKWKDAILNTMLGKRDFVFFDNVNQTGHVLHVGKLTNENLSIGRITLNNIVPVVLMP